MKQIEIINKLNQLDVFGQLKETTNIYEHYDCYNDNYLIEIKSRQREYNPWLIEKYKYDKNYTQATKDKKLFIYVIEYKTRIIAVFCRIVLINNLHVLVLVLVGKTLLFLVAA